MSDTRLVERCTLEFERYVAKLRLDVLATHSGVARASIPTVPYEIDYTASDIPSLAREMGRAYEARAMFAIEGPAWAQMLPIGEECYPLQKATGALFALGSYGFSLQLMDYAYFEHPKFYDFVCGMMAHPHAPEHVRDDIDLQAEFPAKELPGLSGRMIWFGERLPSGERLRALGRHNFS
jgi:hypothetical protein